LNSTLPLSEILLRVGVALVAGFLLGFEREGHGRSAGLKTTILACVSSAMAMILSEHFYLESLNMPGVFRPDRARLAAGILTGIGFLGGGAILRQGNAVRGVTTAAVLWFITILGLTFGSGHIALGGIGTSIALLTLYGLPILEHKIKRDNYAMLSVAVHLDGISENEIKSRIESTGVTLLHMNFEYDLDHDQKVLHCQLKFRDGDMFSLSQSVVTILMKCKGISSIKWH
jgi:putative Mg2+ transporter-C (MgtC) family protein